MVFGVSEVNYEEGELWGGSLGGGMLHSFYVSILYTLILLSQSTPFKRDTHCPFSKPS